jgi:uncharacterized protein (TIGR02996 family)
MSDEAALLSAIIHHPDEDTPRLAYADWLDENDDPDRAEFIRVQIRLADMPPGDPDWVDLTARQSELACRLKHLFLTRVGEDADGFDFGTDLVGELEEPFRRGFPYTVTCQSEGDEWTAEEVTRVANELTRLVRTTTIRAFQGYSTPVNRLRDLLKAPIFTELTGLTLHPFARSRGEAAGLPHFYRFLASAPRCAASNGSSCITPSRRTRSQRWRRRSSPLCVGSRSTKYRSPMGQAAHEGRVVPPAPPPPLWSRRPRRVALPARAGRTTRTAHARLAEIPPALGRRVRRGQVPRARAPRL